MVCSELLANQAYPLHCLFGGLKKMGKNCREWICMDVTDMLLTVYDSVVTVYRYNIMII